MRMILNPDVVERLVAEPLPPALRLDETRARAVARQLDELRRARLASRRFGVAVAA